MDWGEWFDQKCDRKVEVKEENVKKDDLSTLRMIASNCTLPKVQRDELQEIIKKIEKNRWNDLRKKDCPEPHADVLCINADECNYPHYAYSILKVNDKYYDVAHVESCGFEFDMTQHIFQPEYIELQIGNEIGRHYWTDCNIIAWKEVEEFREFEEKGIPEEYNKNIMKRFTEVK